MSNGSSRPTRDKRLSKAFGDRLRSLRKSAGLSQLKLSTSTGVHISFISAIERGARQPSLMTLAKLAGGVGVELDVLVAGIGTKKSLNGDVIARIAQVVRGMSAQKAKLAFGLVETLVKE